MMMLHSAKDAAKTLKRKLVAKTAPATLVKALIVGDWIPRMHIPAASSRQSGSERQTPQPVLTPTHTGLGIFLPRAHAYAHARARTHTTAHKVLETCVKNCGRPFHMQVAERSFCDVLFKLVSISNSGRGTIGGLSREKALGMIQSWADVCRLWLDRRTTLSGIAVPCFTQRCTLRPVDSRACLKTLSQKRKLTGSLLLGRLCLRACYLPGWLATFFGWLVGWLVGGGHGRSSLDPPPVFFLVPGLSARHCTRRAARAVRQAPRRGD